MILQALHDYYKRKPDLPREGFEWKEIPFVIELNRTGEVIQIEDTRTPDGKKKRAKNFLVPQAVKKSVNVDANMLWGNTEYVLALPDIKKLAERKNKGKESAYQNRLKDMHDDFTKKIRQLLVTTQMDEGLQAVMRFCERKEFSDFERFGDLWEEVKETNQNLTFRMQGDSELVCQRSMVVDALTKELSGSVANGLCLVTGDPDEIARLHPAIKGVWGAQTSGANLVSFNLPAFHSRGKEQGTNAPIGQRVAFAYTTALNALLAKDSRQRMQVGDASTVFWADKPSVFEDSFADLFNEPPKDDPDRNARALKVLYEAPQQGIAPINDDNTRFFVLGLSPNAARIAVRFWQVGVVSELAHNIQQHFNDLEIIRPTFEKPHLSIFRLLVATATQGKSENISPNLGGEVMRAILTARLYPATLLQEAVRRIRAERNVNYPRAGIIKACLNRQIRSMQLSEKELTVSLDHANNNPGYRLGRLFAVLEKIQEEANPGINATIRDRFYGAASSTPVTVFSNLMKLKNHHIAKLDNPGRRVNLERLIGEIMEEVTDFPNHLCLTDQGRFAIGYYHQRQALFTKTNETN